MFPLLYIRMTRASPFAYFDSIIFNGKTSYLFKLPFSNENALCCFHFAACANLNSINALHVFIGLKLLLNLEDPSVNQTVAS